MSLVTPTLVTERLRLRPVEDEDAGFLWELMSAPFVLRYWDEPPWRDPSRAQRFVDQSRSAVSEGSGARVMVERVADTGFTSASGAAWQAQVFRDKA